MADDDDIWVRRVTALGAASVAFVAIGAVTVLAAAAVAFEGRMLFRLFTAIGADPPGAAVLTFFTFVAQTFASVFGVHWVYTSVYSWIGAEESKGDRG